MNTIDYFIGKCWPLENVPSTLIFFIYEYFAFKGFADRRVKFATLPILIDPYLSSNCII